MNPQTEEAPAQKNAIKSRVIRARVSEELALSVENVAKDEGCSTAVVVRRGLLNEVKRASRRRVQSVTP